MIPRVTYEHNLYYRHRNTLLISSACMHVHKLYIHFVVNYFLILLKNVIVLSFLNGKKVYTLRDSILLLNPNINSEIDESEDEDIVGQHKWFY